MKILAVGDQHFRLELPYSEYVKDRRHAERQGVYDAVIDASKSCDAVVLMGDNLNARHNHSSVISDFVRFVDRFGDKQVFIISGNHEVYEGHKTAIDFLRGLRNNVRVITPEDGITVDNEHGAVLAFVPYMTNSVLGVTDYKEGGSMILQALEYPGKYDAIFLHHAIEGCGVPGGMTDLFNEIVLPREYLEELAYNVVAGHIHVPQQVGHTTITGSLMTQEMGEESKFVWVLDTEDRSVTAVDMPVRPIYKAVDPSISHLDSLDKGAIIKVVLTRPGQDVESIREKLREFDASIVFENYPDERRRLTVDTSAVLDLSVENLLQLYAQAKGKDPERLKKALKLIEES